MKKTLLILVSIAFTCYSYSQSPFGPKQSISTNTGGYPKVIESGKINNDNLADIVIGTFVGGTVEWFKNNGDGTFTLQALVSSSLGRVNGLSIADLDNDNDNDIIATSYPLGQVVWFKNNGNGTFGTAQVIASGLTSVNTVKAGDIDGNNTIDVAVSAYGTNGVYWYSNNGSGNFGSAQTISGISNSGPVDFDLADYDQDNDLDVVVAYGLINAIILFDNDLAQTGNPTFNTYALVDSANYDLMDVRFGDMDNNGDLEIIKADKTANIAYYNKTGSGFSETAFSTSNTSPSAVIVLDIDDNNLNDVIVGYASTSYTDKITWYKDSNTSSEATIDSSQNDIYNFTLNDFDNDGDLDMASVSSSENHLNWFKNIGLASPCIDSDNDSVCDSVDKCPGFDDNIDINNNGIPDGCESITCNTNTTDFSVNPLTHTGAGSNSTTLTLPDNSSKVNFTISSINDKTKGKSNSYYNERVVITYTDGSGAIKNYGTYLGSNFSSVTVDINDTVKTVTVTLNDALDGNTGSTMSVNLSTVSYCGEAIQSSSCAQNTVDFKNSTLTQTGTGSSATTVNLLANGQDAAFTISGIDEKLKGKQGSQYIEHVKVTYVDGSGSTKTYNEYSGSNNSSVDVFINGMVRSITVSLDDQLNSGTSSTMSVDLSTVSYCVSSTARISDSVQSANLISELNTTSVPELTFKVYPNPASHILFIKNTQSINEYQTNISLYNLQGTQVRSMHMNNDQTREMNIDGLSTGLYVLRIVDQNGNTLKSERIVIK